jgi:hypothetical protein
LPSSLLGPVYRPRDVYLVLLWNLEASWSIFSKIKFILGHLAGKPSGGVHVRSLAPKPSSAYIPGAGGMSNLVPLRTSQDVVDHDLLAAKQNLSL